LFKSEGTGQEIDDWKIYFDVLPPSPIFNSGRKKGEERLEAGIENDLTGVTSLLEW
jgi:hypothetical protein